MKTTKIFLASSSELKADRQEFESFVSRQNNEWVRKGMYLERAIWEDVFDGISQTRLQDEYNKAIRDCDLCVMLFGTKVGAYSLEEFETALGQFKETNNAFLFTYFKDAQVSTATADETELMSLWAFKIRLK